MAASPINNPHRILLTLDSHLERETRIVLFGRAALALGFGDNGARFGKTQDVDAILPTVEMARIESDGQFWRAIELTNKSLEASGLYLSHLFTDRQIALTPDWLGKILAVPSSGYKFLRLFRPSSVDLIMTKMMRNDREDLEDIRFIMGQEKISRSQLELAFLNLNPLEIPEIQDIFVKMQPVVCKMAEEMELAWQDKGRPGSKSRVLNADWWSNYIPPNSIEREKERDREIEL
jgi:hypothetical protein